MFLFHLRPLHCGFDRFVSEEADAKGLFHLLTVFLTTNCFLMFLPGGTLPQSGHLVMFIADRCLLLFSRESDSRIANVRLSIIHLKPLSLSLYLSLLLSARLCLMTIIPISIVIFFHDF